MFKIRRRHKHNWSNWKQGLVQLESGAMVNAQKRICLTCGYAHREYL